MSTSGTSRRLFGRYPTRALLLVCSVSSLAAFAQDWKPVGAFGWHGTGRLQELEKGHFYWVGEFSGIFLSDKGEGGLFHHSGVRCPAFNDIDLNNRKHRAGGYCVLMDADGDQAFGAWQSAGDGRRGPGTFSFTGGTGKYKGIAGGNSFVGTTEVQWPDGGVSGYSTWNK